VRQISGALAEREVMNVCSARTDANPSLNPTTKLLMKNLLQSVPGLFVSHLLQITIGTSCCL